MYRICIAGAFVAIALVDRVGRLPLLRFSSAMAMTVLSLLVAAAMININVMHITLEDGAARPPIHWARLQLAVLAILSVRVTQCDFVVCTYSVTLCRETEGQSDLSN